MPPKSNRSDPICFSPYLYRARNQVERFFNRIKQCRRVATRYDRLAANYLVASAAAEIERDGRRRNQTSVVADAQLGASPVGFDDRPSDRAYRG